MMHYNDTFTIQCLKSIVPDGISMAIDGLVFNFLLRFITALKLLLWRKVILICYSHHSLLVSSFMSAWKICSDCFLIIWSLLHSYLIFFVCQLSSWTLSCYARPSVYLFVIYNFKLTFLMAMRAFKNLSCNCWRYY